MQHLLSLSIPDVSSSEVLRISDTSIYSSLTPFTCPILSVTVPGYSNSVQFTNLTEAFTVNLSACDLQVQRNLCGIQFDSLVDGIYVINWSVSPNESVYVLYNHLRITNFLTKYNKALCELQLSTCAPSQEVHRKYEELRKIYMYVIASKAQVEISHNAEKGMELYLYAERLINRWLKNECRGI